jgi:hypothetical protein
MTPPPKDKGTWTANPFSPIPTPIEEDSEEEVSKIHNAPDAWKKLEKIDGVIHRMIEPIRMIPDINDKVSNLGERVSKVEERLQVTKEQIGELDRPHNCLQVVTIQKVEGATEELRKAIEDDDRKLAVIGATVTSIDENGTKFFKDTTRTNYYFWAGTLVTLLFSVFGAIWYVRGITADIALESQTRDVQYRHVEEILNKVSVQTNPAPITEKIDQLQTAVEQGNGTRMSDWCSKLSDDDVLRIKLVLPRQTWPECPRLNIQPPGTEKTIANTPGKTTSG